MTLAHDVAGAGPVVVLLHSSVGDRRMWNAQVDPLVAAGYQVVRCDFRGYGDTPPAEVHRDAEDVRDLLDDLGVASAAVVGASLGGRIAHEVAARWPDRVDALALLCPGMRAAPTTPDIVEFSQREEALLAAGELDEVAELYLDLFLGPDADEHTRAALRAMRRHSLAVQRAFGAAPTQPGAPVDLARVTAPTLILSGAHDLRYFRDIAAVLAERIPHARHVALPWAGHLPAVERPAEITALLVEFLAEARAARPQTGAPALG
ncbi:alpha/beta fold hydrolase [Goodfellowiella coeruleoviolacea]|uniref:Pimeloyl-ACP methyl ester carboxylesterase n=1 Tax=Goodfellowiella coeruleoviolacea TaxID=334858 RepID=A0AAE3GD42_9PSEU|nr:alpha/beta fold hydrolase [Goodfellowiella coeruleoviolacea]MCP2166021.1 Pimeloyl-ACP methyl ester carboxylesterase [Goodfellowiella coeruleoviolacea]